MTYFNLYSVKLQDLEQDDQKENFLSRITYDGDLESHGMKIVDITSDKIELEFLPRYPEFYDLIYSIDNYVVDGIMANGEKWFGSKPNYDTVHHMFQNSIDIPTSLHHCPTMTVYMNKNCQILGKKGDVIDLNDLQVNSEVSIDLTLSHIIFKTTKCHLVYEAKRILVTNLVGTVTESIMDSTEEYSDVTEALYAMTSTSENSSE